MSPRRRTPVLGTPALRLPETSSTIDDARELANQGAAHGTAVIADRQGAGRGRRGRAWHTVPGKSLAVTVILRHMPDPAHLGLAGMAGALAVVGAAQKVLGAQLKTRWPNDVVHQGRKLAGTLAERAADALLLSIGLNINGTRVDFPPEIREQVATLEIVVGQPVDREEVTAAVFASLTETWHQLAQRPEEIVRRWEPLDITRGARVRLQEANGACSEGRGLGIDEAGRLRFETGEGAIRLLSAADVTVL